MGKPVIPLLSIVKEALSAETQTVLALWRYLLRLRSIQRKLLIALDGIGQITSLLQGSSEQTGRRLYHQISDANKVYGAIKRSACGSPMTFSMRSNSWREPLRTPLESGKGIFEALLLKVQLGGAGLVVLVFY
jgi:hypothetical protein